MPAFELRFVDAQRDRHGRVTYWYFRRGGRRWRLPGEPGSETFMAEYHRLVAATEPARPSGDMPHPAGSLGALVLDYLASPEFKAKKASSQSLYRRILDPIRRRIGHHAVRHIERRHVKAMRDEKADTPGMANMVVKVLRLLLSYAVDNDWIASNPALRVKTFKLGEHRAWTAEEMATFERRWAPGTMQRRAYMLALYTGQRRGDLATMTRAHRKGGEIRVVQEKTNAELWIPEHRDLAAELARGDAGHMSLLTTTDGSGFDAKALGKWFADVIDKAGLPDDCVLHGLRKTAARALAEAGCTVHEIQAITGHKSLGEVERYTRGASQRTGAAAAITKLEANRDRTRTAKRRSKGLPNGDSER
jgi:enterobacteria phage integrase